MRTTASCLQHRYPEWQPPTCVCDAAKPPRLQALPSSRWPLPQPGWCHLNFNLVPRSQRQKNLCSLWLVKSDPQPDLLREQSPTWNSRCPVFPQHNTANILRVLSSKGLMTAWNSHSDSACVCVSHHSPNPGCDLHELTIKSRMVSTFT